MLWLAVFLPQLCLEVFTRGIFQPDLTRVEQRQKIKPPSGFRLPDGQAIAIFNQHKIVAANELAQIHGVLAGSKKATALALVTDLQLFERQPEREAQCQLEVAQWLLQFTPLVSLQGEEGKTATSRKSTDRRGVLLDITGSLRLFGGLEALVTQIRSGLMAMGFEAQWASAPTPQGAWLLAQHQSGCTPQTPAQMNTRLTQVPLSYLISARPHLETLHGLGVRTIKELLNLPRAGLARRFGPNLLDEIDRALGRIPEPREIIAAPQSFELKLELMAQVESAEALVFAGRRMLMSLQGWLATQHAGIRSYEFAAQHDDREPTIIMIELAEPTRDLDRLCILLRERLEKITLPQAVHSLILRAREIIRVEDQNAQLFPSPTQMQEGLARLVERLQTKLGKDTVQAMTQRPDHRPERAYQISPMLKLPPSLAKTNGKSAAQTPSTEIIRLAVGLPRPLWLFSEPITIREQQHRPWYNGPLQLLAGPERIESGWWDDDLVQRDYFIAEDAEAVLYWIYRTRATHDSSFRLNESSATYRAHDTGLSGPQATWHIQGIFG